MCEMYYFMECILRVEEFVAGWRKILMQRAGGAVGVDSKGNKDEK